MEENVLVAAGYLRIHGKIKTQIKELNLLISSYITYKELFTPGFIDTYQDHSKYMNFTAGIYGNSSIYADYSKYSMKASIGNYVFDASHGNCIVLWRFRVPVKNCYCRFGLIDETNRTYFVVPLINLDNYASKEIAVEFIWNFKTNYVMIIIHNLDTNTGKKRTVNNNKITNRHHCHRYIQGNLTSILKDSQFGKSIRFFIEESSNNFKFEKFDVIFNFKNLIHKEDYENFRKYDLHEALDFRHFCLLFNE